MKKTISVVMCSAILSGLLFIPFLITNAVADPEGQAVSQDNGLPFLIKYPSDWHVRKQGNEMVKEYFISREPIIKMTGIFQVGITIIRSMGKLQAVDWDSFKSDQIYHATLREVEAKDMGINSIDGHPSFVIFVATAKKKMYFVYIKKNSDLVVMVFESPKEEWNDYDALFKESISTFIFKD